MHRTDCVYYNKRNFWYSCRLAAPTNTLHPITAHHLHHLFFLMVPLCYKYIQQFVQIHFLKLGYLLFSFHNIQLLFFYSIWGSYPFLCQVGLFTIISSVLCCSGREKGERANFFFELVSLSPQLLINSESFCCFLIGFAHSLSLASTLLPFLSF